MEVPAFRESFAYEYKMNEEQRRFYQHWLSNWKNGIPIDVAGNISYLFAYTYTVTALDPVSGIAELRRLIECYGHEKDPYPWYCKWWIRDFYLLAGDFRGALEHTPPLKFGATATHQANEILNIKRILDEPIGGNELLGLIGAKVTNWAKGRIADVVAYLDASLAALQRDMGVSLIRDWSRGDNRYGWYLFSGGGETRTLKQPYYCYYAHKEIQEFASKQMREAENTIREEMGVSRVGEGWVAETTLFYQIKHGFPNYEVIQHGRPTWLGRQHLDVYMPDIKVALEYQGPQHDVPVAFFGGEEHFQQSKMRDSKKKQLCRDNGVTLIFVREGYDLPAILREIISATEVQNGRGKADA